jgi:Asp-tRNA(Asn)/Glu-tRNA(Gln) amidotransferase A subunit family amidase
VGFTKAGMPIGLQLIAPPLDEATALRAAHAFDQSFQDTAHRDPGLI